MRSFEVDPGAQKRKMRYCGGTAPPASRQASRQHRAITGDARKIPCQAVNVRREYHTTMAMCNENTQCIVGIFRAALQSLALLPPMSGRQMGPFNPTPLPSAQGRDLRRERRPEGGAGGADETRRARGRRGDGTRERESCSGPRLHPHTRAGLILVSYILGSQTGAASSP